MMKLVGAARLLLIAPHRDGALILSESGWKRDRENWLVRTFHVYRQYSAVGQIAVRELR